MSAKPSRQLGNILRTMPSATPVGETRPDPVLDPGRDALVAPNRSRTDQPAIQVERTSETEVEVEVPLQVTVPKRVRRELLMMAANQDCSVRALILRSVRSLGIEIDEVELRDKRRKG